MMRTISHTPIWRICKSSSLVETVDVNCIQSTNMMEAKQYLSLKNKCNLMMDHNKSLATVTSMYLLNDLCWKKNKNPMCDITKYYLTIPRELKELPTFTFYITSLHNDR